jgi:penicillin-binding protein 2
MRVERTWAAQESLSGQRWQALCCELICLLALAVACRSEPTATPTPVPTPTPALADAESIARDYLRAWQDGAYDRMYTWLSPSAMASTPADKFISRYKAIAEEASITAVTASVTGVQRKLADAAVVSFTLTADTRLAGQFRVENVLDLTFVGQRWTVEWAPKAIFPLLLRDNLVHMFVRAPSRGSILDRKDRPLATEGQVIEVGVVTGQIKDEAQLLTALRVVLGLSEGSIQAKYQAAARPDWFMPVGEIALEAAQLNQDLLSSDPGIVWREKAVRSYPYGGMASHVIGYLAEVDAATLAQLEPKGYQSGDLIGASGLEAWGEQYLAGARGGTLAIISQEGRIVWTLSERPAEAGQNIYATLDVDLQQAVENILGQRVGAIVVIEVNSGDVLAMASYPGFNPQVLTGGATSSQWQALLGDAQRPLLNRAVAGIYPPGSAFKIVTLSAGLDALGLNARSPFYCAGRWDGLDDGAVRHCWLKTGHGPISLFEGLVQSCDTVFWEVGKALNERDPTALSRYARGFGLGTATGINELDEAEGLIPDPEWKRNNYSGAEQEWLPRDAVNMAIGQGDVLVTPLQMARLCAAVANGGTLYRPRLVRRIGTALGGVQQVSAAEFTGRLPVSTAELQLVQSAMESVVLRGTASNAFRGATVRMAGKSGTAEAPPGETHAWFVGYAPADAPQIAVAVVLEHGGEGGGKAAPLFRQVVESYLALPR